MHRFSTYLSHINDDDDKDDDDQDDKNQQKKMRMREDKVNQFILFIKRILTNCFSHQNILKNQKVAFVVHYQPNLIELNVVIQKSSLFF